MPRRTPAFGSCWPRAVCRSDCAAAPDRGDLLYLSDASRSGVRLLCRHAERSATGPRIQAKARFATAILNGTKTVELRRTRVSAPPGTPLVLYASSPVMAIIGTATLADRHTASPAAIWRAHRHALGLTRAEFTDYLTGVDQATAITIASPQALPDPFTLAWLRRPAGFQPPQSYRYIAPNDPTPLQNLASAHIC